MLSTKYLNGTTHPVHFKPDELGCALRKHLPEADFCYLLGSAVNGTVAAGSDLDLAFYLNNKPSLAFYEKVAETVRQLLPEVRCDAGILNAAEPVYRFEAIKGRLLFCRDEEQTVAFFSRTCREYESQMADYERQLMYRREAVHAI